MTKGWILTAIGKDRPGIVAGVTKVVYSLGGNLEDSAMTRLAGEFAIMLVFSAPGRVTANRLDRAFRSIASRLGLAIHLKPLMVAARRPGRQPRLYLISVYGADRPGIVYRVAELLARSRINITNLSTHRGTGKRPLYHLLLEVEGPARLALKQLEYRLTSLARQLGVTVSVRTADTAVL